MSLIGVTIDDKHSYNDYGLIMGTRTIGSPSPQTKYVEVPLRDGSLDFTEALTGDVKYDDREISLTLYSLESSDKWPNVVSEIAAYLHGQRRKLIFDDDIGFYYDCRLSIKSTSIKKGFLKIDLTGTAAPYKMSKIASNEEWEWDSFNFETDFINEGNLTVNGEDTVTLIGGRKKTSPIFICSDTMTLTFEGIEYTLQEGSNINYEIALAEGENVLKFTGNGTVSIVYRVGVL